MRRNEPPGMPKVIEPQLATLAKQPPAHGDWSYEIKFDGYRMMARLENCDVRLVTRNGYDWTDRMPKLRDALDTLQVHDAWLDGEAVVLNAAGVPDFNALQNAFDRPAKDQILLFLFDALWMNGTDLRAWPLRDRRAVLSDLLKTLDSPLVRYSEEFEGDPVSILESPRKVKLEGIIGKRTDAPYRSGRSGAAPEALKGVRAIVQAVGSGQRRPDHHGPRARCVK